MPCVCTVNDKQVHSCEECCMECCGCFPCKSCKKGSSGGSKISTAAPRHNIWVPTFGTQAHIDTFHQFNPYSDEKVPTFWGQWLISPIQAPVFGKMTNAEVMNYYTSWCDGNKQSESLLFKANQINGDHRFTICGVETPANIKDWIIVNVPEFNQPDTTSYTSQLNYYQHWNIPTAPTSGDSKIVKQTFEALFPQDPLKNEWKRAPNFIPMVQYNDISNTNAHLLYTGRTVHPMPVVCLIVDWSDTNSIESSIVKFVTETKRLAEGGCFIPLHLSYICIISMNQSSAVTHEYTPFNVEDKLKKEVMCHRVFKRMVSNDSFTQHEDQTFAQGIHALFLSMCIHGGDFDITSQFVNLIDSLWIKRMHYATLNAAPLHRSWLDTPNSHPMYNADHMGYLLPMLKLQQKDYKIPHTNIAYNTIVPFEYKGRDTKIWIYDEIGGNNKDVWKKAVAQSRILSHCCPEINNNEKSYELVSYDQFQSHDLVYKATSSSSSSSTNNNNNNTNEIAITIPIPHPYVKDTHRYIKRYL